MIALEVAGLEAQVWPSPTASMPRTRREALLPDLWTLVNDGFGAAAGEVGDADVEKFFLGAQFVISLFDGRRCRAAFMVDAIDIGSQRVLYLSGAAVHSELRGRGIYVPMILIRLALGRHRGCEWWATRTVNPLVVQQFIELEPYPWFIDERSRTVAIELADVLTARFGIGDSRAGQGFDARTGVLERSYPTYPYHEPPRSDAAAVAEHFARHVDHARGDAVLLLGPLDAAIDRFAPSCDARLGCSFDELAGRLATVGNGS